MIGGLVDPALSPWLQAGAMLVLFGLAWAVASRLFRHLHMPWPLMVAANLLGGAGMLLAGLRGALPYGLTHTLPNLLNLACFAALWLVANAIVGRRVAAHEPVATLLAGTVLVLACATEPAREAATAIVGCWMAVRGGWQVVVHLRSLGSSGTGWAVAACNGTVALALLGRGLAALLSPEALADADSEATRQAMAWQVRAFFVGGFWVNMVMAYGTFGQLMRQVHRLQQRDRVTGLPDRATVMRVLDFEFGRSRRRPRPLCLLSISTDQLAAVAASAGAATADALLAALALELRTRLRPGDVLGHCGDGVFLAVLPDTPEPEAQVLARAVADAVAAQPALHPDGNQPVTLSIGLAGVRPTDASPAGLLARAQLQRWVAHHAGGNRAVSAGVVRVGA